MNIKCGHDILYRTKTHRKDQSFTCHKLTMRKEKQRLNSTTYSLTHSFTQFLNHSSKVNWVGSVNDQDGAQWYIF